ncbi:MAG: type VI secretion system tip protein VgrG [Bacteroidota bacterium]|nr:Rhs element Vgr protein [Odoribacter sp.]MDP3644704.1 type VI secretion system tip protein VgrG [Bacteroidota bacterium]
MNNSRNIQTSRSADLITHKILIDGTELPATVQVMNINVEKEINRIPSAKIILIDGDPSSQEFVLSNGSLLIPGKEIEIKAGYHSDEETIFKGIIIKHSLKIRASHSLLIIECRDKAVKMTSGRKSKFYLDSKDSDVIEEIVSPYGLDPDIEATGFQHKKIVRYDCTDWDFVITRAQANGKICVVDDGKITVKAPDFSQAELETVAFGATLLDFDAEIDARNQFSKVTSYVWNPANQEVTETEATDPAVSLNGNLTAGELASVIELENLELRYGGTVADRSIQDWANAKALFNQLSKVRGRVKFQGIPACKPNTTLMLEGVGDRFNGKVYISAVRHEITEGQWTIDAQFGINPNWFSETYNISSQPASGLFPAIHGLQIGIVTQLESDPDGEDRIKIKCPMIDKDSEGIWARIASLDAGNERGVFFRPEIEDEVIVGFINDNPNDAVVLGMLNSSAKPAPLTAADANNEKGFVTREKIKFIFNDEKKSVVLETPGGKKITVDDDAGVIKLEDENSNVITMNSDGIKMESNGKINLKAAQDVTIEGMNVSLKANAMFKGEGSAGAELSTSGAAIVKGSVVQIN